MTMNGRLIKVSNRVKIIERFKDNLQQYILHLIKGSWLLVVSVMNESNMIFENNFKHKSITDLCLV